MFQFLLFGLSLAQRMSTFAGSAQGLKDSSEATFANFYSPKQLVFDSGSNLFVVDSDNNAIRRISAAGLVTTVAGASSRGRVDGAGKDARFSQPTGMTIDDSNFLYIADTGNSLIRKMTADYVVTTIAGTGAKGSVNGISTAASFNNPEGITIDKSTGTLYVADSSNNCIRKIAWNGVVTNLATQYRDWNGVFQNFNYPTGIYYSPNTPNLMYVSDANGNYVHKVYTNGSAVVFAGSGVIGSRDGNSSRATFNFPHQIWVNKDELVYVVDQQNSAIRVIEKNGNVTTVPYYTKETSSSLSKGKLFLPVGIVGSMTTVGDTGNNKIKQLEMKICSTNQYYNGTGCSRCLNGTISAEGSVGSTSCRVSNVDSAAVGLIIGLAVGIPLLLILCCFCGCFAAGYFSKSSTRGQVQPQNNGPYQQLAPQNGQPQMYQQPPQNVYQPPQHYGQPGYMQGPPPPPQNYGQPVVYQQPYQSAYNSGQPQGYYQPAYPPPR